MHEHDSVGWARVRAEFILRSRPITHIAESYGISTSTIYRRAHRENWLGDVRADDYEGSGRYQLLRRLCRAIDRKIAQLEARMESSETLTIADHERETRAIGQLIRNVEKIAELEDAGRKRSRGQGGADEAGDVDAEQIRRELAERILRFREVKKADG